jgi:hypothetical protein
MNYPFPNAGLLSQGTGMGLLGGGGGGGNLGGEFSRLQTMNAQNPMLARQWALDSYQPPPAAQAKRIYSLAELPFLLNRPAAIGPADAQQQLPALMARPAALGESDFKQRLAMMV